MTAPTGDAIETRLADLGALTLADLRGMPERLEPYREVLVAQVEKPRLNLGTGPPGRAD